MLQSIFSNVPAFTRQNITLLACALFLLCISLTNWVVFETNDDALMMHIVAGSISGEASPFLLFSNWYWGVFLMQISQYLPFINSYTLVFVVLHLIVNSIVNRNIISRKLPLIWTIIFTVFQMLLLLKLQFTSTAILVGTASIILFLDGKYLVGAMLLVVCSLIRWEALLLIIVVWSAYFVYEAFTKKQLFSLFFYLCSVFICFFLKFQHDDIYTQYSSDSTIFTPKTANSLKTLMDFSGAIDEKALQKINWTPNDYVVFKQWFWADSTTFSKQKIEQLAKETAFDFKFLPKIKHIAHFGIYHFGFCLALGLLFFWLKAQLFYKKHWLVLLPFMLLLCSFFMLNRFLPRVVLPMSMGIFFTIFIQIQTKQMPVLRKIVMPVLMLLLLQVGWTIYENQQSRAQYQSCQNMLDKYPNGTIINVQSALNIEGCTIWQNPNQYSHRNFTFVDVLVGYPTYEKFMASRGINNLFQSIYKKEDVLLIADNVAPIQLYIEEHFHQKTKIDTLEKSVYANVHLFKISEQK